MFSKDFNLRTTSNPALSGTGLALASSTISFLSQSLPRIPISLILAIQIGSGVSCSLNEVAPDYRIFSEDRPDPGRRDFQRTGPRGGNIILQIGPGARKVCWSSVTDDCVSLLLVRRTAVCRSASMARIASPAGSWRGSAGRERYRSPAQLFRRIPDIQRPFLVAPCHDSIWSDQQRAGFLDLAHALPLAVEVLRYD